MPIKYKLEIWNGKKLTIFSVDTESEAKSLAALLTKVGRSVTIVEA